MVYGYARTSEMDYMHNDECLKMQQCLLKNAGSTKVFVDENSMVRSHRPAFEELVEILEDGDRLVVTKLDRIVGSIKDGVNLFFELIERGVVVHILDMGVMDNTDETKQIRDIFGAFAEFENTMFVERMQVGKKIAKMSEGFKEGRPRVYSEEEVEKALDLLRDHSYRQVEAMTGISKSTLIRAKRKKSNQ